MIAVAGTTTQLSKIAAPAGPKSIWSFPIYTLLPNYTHNPSLRLKRGLLVVPGGAALFGLTLYLM
jgi:hypothetical protein